MRTLRLETAVSSEEKVSSEQGQHHCHDQPPRVALNFAWCKTRTRRTTGTYFWPLREALVRKERSKGGGQ